MPSRLSIRPRSSGYRSDTTALVAVFRPAPPKPSTKTDSGGRGKLPRQPKATQAHGREQRRCRQHRLVAEAIHDRPRHGRRDEHADEQDAEQLALLGQVDAEPRPHLRQAEQRAQQRDDGAEEEHAGAGAGEQTATVHGVNSAAITIVRKARAQQARPLSEKVRAPMLSSRHPRHEPAAALRRGSSDRSAAAQLPLQARRTSCRATTKQDSAKVTYATMAAGHMEDLQREIDAESAKVRAVFGSTYPMFIDGQEVVRIGRLRRHQPDRHPDPDRQVPEGHAGSRQGRRCGRTRRLPRLEAPGGGRNASVLSGRSASTSAPSVPRCRRSSGTRPARAGSRRSARSRSRRTSSPTTPTSSKSTDAYPHRHGRPRLARGERAASSGRTASGPSSRRSTFPLALAAGPTAAALLAGNTVVFKPATDTPLVGLKLYELVGRGPAARRLQLRDGRRRHRRAGARRQPRRSTASCSPARWTSGMRLIRDNAARPDPAPADHRDGRQEPGHRHGVGGSRQGQRRRHAIGLRQPGPEVLGLLAGVRAREGPRPFRRDCSSRRRERIRIGNPLERDVWMGPVINEAAVKTYEEAIARAQADGGQDPHGRRRLLDEPFNHGYFVEPTVVDRPARSTTRCSAQELFVPIVVVVGVSRSWTRRWRWRTGPSTG